MYRAKAGLPHSTAASRLPQPCRSTAPGAKTHPRTRPPISGLSTEQQTADLGQTFRQSHRLFRGNLANHLAGIPLGYLYQHASTVLIQLKLDIVMGRLHKILHIRYRRQHLLTIRLGRALVLQQLGLSGISLGRSCIRNILCSGSRSTYPNITPAAERSHIHGFSSEQDKAGEELPLPPPVIPLAYLSPAG